MGDTIEIIQGTATTVEIAGLQGPQGPQGATGATGATGPQGVPGTGIETLTTKGDLLYRDSVAARLPIGSSGQILKVAASGIPEWGAAPASGVSSVAGRTGDVTLAVADVSGAVSTSRQITAGTGLTGGGDLTANRTLAVSYGSSAGTACEGNDPRLSDSRQPTLHAASHLPSGADELFDQSLNTTDSPEFANITTDGLIQHSSNGNFITLLNPAQTDNVEFANNLQDDLTLDDPTKNGVLFYLDRREGFPVVTVYAKDADGVEDEFDPAFEISVAGKVTAKSEIEFGDSTDHSKKVTFDVSGVESGETRTLEIPDASGVIALTTDNADQFGSGAATDGWVLTADGAGGAAWEAATGGDTVSIETTAADILSVASGAISADDAGADRIVYWNNTNNKLAYGTPSDVGAAASSHTHSEATQSVAGFLSASDKTKLDGIASGANNYTHPNHTGDVTSVGDGATTIANNAVTYAKMQDISATSRILGRKTAAAGDTEECTLSEILDFVGSAAQGDLLIRGASTWTRLAAGTNGHYLQTKGSGANPEWAAVAGGGATNLWIPASAFIPKTTASCGVDSRETATNDQNFDELLFDAGSDEFADALVVMPSNYNNGTITARFYWTAASGSGDVIWGIQGRAFANDDALDTAAGTAQTVTDTLIAANDMHVSGATSAVTIGGTPAANTPIQFSIYRDANAAGDTLAVDARLLGVSIDFN